MCSQAPALLAASARSGNGSKEPEFTFPACAPTMQELISELALLLGVDLEELGAEFVGSGPDLAVEMTLPASPPLWSLRYL